jgi:hypothetical protein
MSGSKKLDSTLREKKMMQEKRIDGELLRVGPSP